MNSSKRNIDTNQSANTNFTFSLPISTFENVNANVATVDRKRKATWEAGGPAKKKRTHCDIQAKRQLFNTKAIKKKKNNSNFTETKKTKVLFQKIIYLDGHEFSSTNAVTDYQVNYSEFPSKSGRTDDKFKVTVLTENETPTKRVEKTKWKVSKIPLHFKEALANTVKS
ncbi:uncharacterized protein LOC131671913 [Phymastichus coffea]|uniref:uncharacterized protein LOC131671913 n=1 Tax=Phymastichus coffea TaxID=108790 RepID=UPI00273AB2BB|nr:uncharacterized protein LOC131671913 [Phymastichus coffea]